MCGFIGAFGPSAPGLRENFQEALGLLGHRGPDSRGIYESSENKLLLGHTRLSILDLSEVGNQPFLNGKDVLVYNGELYNHMDFRNSRESYRSTSDTETLARLGADLVNQIPKFIGMFAGALWVDSEKTLVLFRDPMGIKPLHYLIKADGTVIFGSDERAVFHLAKIGTKKVNVDSLELLLRFENFPLEQSLFAELKSLAPGEVLRLKLKDQGTVQRESSLVSYEADFPIQKSHQELVNQIDEELNLSVKRHLISDVPVAVYLSGGIDSSLVASVAAKNSSYKITGYTGYFDLGGPFDERYLSQAVAKNAGIDFQDVRITAEDFIDELDPLVLHLGQPRMGFGSFSQSLVARRVAASHKVILSGHGGDELFWGYPYMGAVLNKLDSRIPISKMSKVFKHYLTFNKLRGAELTAAPEIWNRAVTNEHFQLGSEFQEWPRRLADYYQNIYIQGLLAVEDKVSMRHSLETRMPLWSQPIQRLANQISPFEHFKKGGKTLLREVAARYVPRELFDAPKRGFPTPLKSWLKKELFEFANERLSRDSEVLDFVLPKSGRIKMLSRFKNRPSLPVVDERNAHRIWILLILESWERQFEVQFAN